MPLERRTQTIACPKCRSKLEVRRRYGYSFLEDVEIVEATDDADDDLYRQERNYAFVAVAVLAIALVGLVALVGAFTLEYPSVFDMFVAWLRLVLQSL